MSRLEQGDPAWLDPNYKDLPTACTRAWPALKTEVRVKPPRDSDRSDRFLEQLARERRIAIIADSFTASTYVPAALALSDEVTSVDSGLLVRRVARAFKRRYRCQAGTLLLRSQRYVWERAAEPPPALVDQWKRDKEADALGLTDYVTAATLLSRAQLRVLGLIRSDNGLSFWREALAVERSRDLLRFIGMLPGFPANGTEALGEKQIEVPANLLRQAYRLFWSGQPTTAFDHHAQATSGAAGVVVSWRFEAHAAVVRFEDRRSGTASTHRLQLASP
jgi:hypothetical protein